MASAELRGGRFHNPLLSAFVMLVCSLVLTILLLSPSAHSEDARASDAESLPFADLLFPQVRSPSLVPGIVPTRTPRDEESPTSTTARAASEWGDGRQAAGDTARWSSFLPIGGEKAQEKGYELPFPFGIAGSFFYGYRDINVESVDVDMGNMSLAVDRLAHIDVKSDERNWSMRFDAWILPLMNCYLLAGYTKQDSDVGISLAPPLLHLMLPRHYHITLELDGTTFGGGTTLVGGYKQFYLAADTNYTFSKLKGELTSRNTFDQTVDALLISTRAGWRTRIGPSAVNLWIGGTYWGIAQTVDGSVAIPLLGTVDFEVKESPARDFSAHLGTHIEITDQINLTCDVGSNFGDMVSIVPAFFFRF